MKSKRAPAYRTRIHYPLLSNLDSAARHLGYLKFHSAASTSAQSKRDMSLALAHIGELLKEAQHQGCLAEAKTLVRVVANQQILREKNARVRSSVQRDPLRRRGARKHMGQRTLFWEEKEDGDGETMIHVYVNGPGAGLWAKNQQSIMGTHWEEPERGGDFAYAMFPAEPNWQKEVRKEYPRVKLSYVQDPPRSWIGQGERVNRHGIARGRRDPVAMPCRDKSVENAMELGFLEAFWLNPYMDWAEEKGLDYRTGHIPQHVQGLNDIPQTPPASAKKLAKKFGALLVKLNKASLTQIYGRACQAEGSTHVNAKELGYYLAMQAQGHGVSWADSHKAFPVKFPRAEVHAYGNKGRVQVNGYVS